MVSASVKTEGHCTKLYHSGKYDNSSNTFRCNSIIRSNRQRFRFNFRLHFFPTNSLNFKKPSRLSVHLCICYHHHVSSHIDFWGPTRPLREALYICQYPGALKPPSVSTIWPETSSLLRFLSLNTKQTNLYLN